MMQRIHVAAVGAALALAQACGPSEKPAGTAVKPAPVQAEKPKRLELPPLAAPDCAAAVPALTGERLTVKEADGLRAPATDGPVKLSAGPILGDVTDQNVTVWVSLDRPAPWRVTAWPVKGAKKKVVVEGSAPTQATDFTATARLAELTPSTEYAYEVELGAGKDAIKAAKGSFHTLAPPGTPGKVRIAVGARLSAEPEQPIFSQIVATKPDLMMLLGDQIYAGNLKANFPAYANKYQKNWGIHQLKDMMSAVPTYMMWDDQDIKNNYFEGSSENRYVPARLAFELYGAAHNPPPVRDGELSFQFQAGEVSFFVIDGRSHRTDPDGEDSPDKTMLGEAQKADLARFLKCAPGKVKVVATPLAFSNQVRGQGSWREYEAERQQLIHFIEDHQIDNVIMLTGDQSWSALLLHEHKRTRFYELMPTPLSKELGKAPAKESKGIVARDDDNHVFGVVDIDTSVTPATIAFTVCAKDKPCKPGEEPAPTSGLDQEGDKENVPYTLKITVDDIGPKEPATATAGDAPKAGEAKPAEPAPPAGATKAEPAASTKAGEAKPAQ